jgi:hypothetical protein
VIYFFYFQRYRKHPHSSFLLINENCIDHDYYDILVDAPYMLFFHFGNCTHKFRSNYITNLHSMSKTTIFPNAILCLQCTSTLQVRMLLNSNTRTSLFSNPSHLINASSSFLAIDPPIYVKILGKWSARYVSCKLHVKTPLFSKPQYCLLGEYVIEFLKARLRFQANSAWVSSRFGPEPDMYGHIDHRDPEPSEKCIGDCLFLLDKSVLTALYCNFDPHRSLQINFSAWWEPFRPEIWLCLLTAFVTISIAMEYIASFGFLQSVSLACEPLQIVRSVLRQDDLKRNLLLVMFCFIMMKLTSLYENIITSQLIVPDKEIVYKTFVELVENHYEFQSSFNIETLTPTIQSYLNRINKSITFSEMKFERVKSSFKFDIVANSSLRKSYLNYNTENLWYYHIQYLNQKYSYSCHTVVEPLSTKLSFMDFHNFLTHVQMNVMLKLRDHGFLAWWKHLETFSIAMMYSMQNRNRTISEDYSESFISNLNIVPVYTVWMSLLIGSMIVFTVECRKQIRFFDGIPNQIVISRILKYYFASTKRMLQSSLRNWSALCLRVSRVFFN